jgi:hypothetical protein
MTMILDLVAVYNAAPELTLGPEPAACVTRRDGDGDWELKLVLFGTAKGKAANDGPTAVAVKAEVPLVLDHLPDDAERQRVGRPLYGLRKLAPSCWKLWGPPLPINQQIATYLTITDVAEPAPWESRLVLVPA